MKQLQIVYTDEQALRQTLSNWKTEVEARGMAAFAHIFYKYDAPKESLSTLQMVRETFSELLPQVPYVGCTASGEIADGHITEEEITITLTLYEQADSKAMIIAHAIDDMGPENLQRMLKELQNQKDLKGIEIISAISHDQLMEIVGTMDHLPENVAIFGGVAVSDDDHLPKVFTNKCDPDTDLFAVVVYSGSQLHIHTDRVNGWKQIGFPIRVTKSRGNMLYELNHKPAYEVYNHYLNIPNDKNLFYNALEFPFLVTEPDGNHYLRYAKACLPDGTIIMSTDVMEGSTIHMTYEDPTAMKADILKGAMGVLDFQPDVTLVCNCLGRKLFWGKDADLDVYRLAHISGIFGFCALGEILRYQGKTMLNNLSSVIVAMREGDAFGTDMPSMIENEDDGHVISLANRLASFINTMTGELTEANHQLKEALTRATVDALTGIYNRGEIERRMSSYFELFDQGGSEICGFDGKYYYDLAAEEGGCIPLNRCAVIMGDIDDFKKINDTFSHQEGDEVLQKVAAAISREIKTNVPYGIVGRWGGEEFMALLPGMDLEQASAVAERIRLAVRNLKFSHYETVSMSFGATEHVIGEDMHTTLSRVDECLYKAKYSGKNRVIKR